MDQFFFRKPTQYAASNEDLDVKMSSPGATDVITDMEPYIPDSTMLAEPEIQLARILEDIKFQHPESPFATIWDMEYIMAHAPSRLRRHIIRKMNIHKNWQHDKLKAFSRGNHKVEFDKMRRIVKSLLQRGKIKPLPTQLIEVSPHVPKKKIYMPKNPRPSLPPIRNTPSKSASGKAPKIGRGMLKKVSMDDEEDGASSQQKRLQKEDDDDSDTDASFTNEEEMIKLGSSTRAIKITPSVKELAISWEFFNKDGPTGRPDWDVLENNVSQPLRQLICKQRKLRSFNDDPTLLLVPPNLRKSFEQVRSEVRRYPTTYTTQLAKKVTQAVTKKTKPGHKRRSRKHAKEDPEEKIKEEDVQDDEDDNMAPIDDIPPSSSASGKAPKIGRGMLKKVSMDDEEDGASSQQKRLQKEDDDDSDTDASFTNEEEMIKLGSSTRAIKITPSVKELAISWEFFNKDGPTGRPDWDVLENNVSQPLRQLICKQRKLRSFNDDPTLLLVPPNLRKSFEQVRSEVRRYPTTYTTQLAKKVTQAVTKKTKPGHKRRSRKHAKEDPEEKIKEEDVQDDEDDNMAPIDDISLSILEDETLSIGQMEELAELMTRAKRRGKSWAYIESRVSPDLKSIMTKAATQPDYLDAPARCLVPSHMWSDFTKIREQVSKARYKDNDDSDYDEEKTDACEMVEKQRQLLQTFSKQMHRTLLDFEAEHKTMFTSRSRDR